MWEIEICPPYSGHKAGQKAGFRQFRIETGDRHYFRDKHQKCGAGSGMAQGASGLLEAVQ